MRPVIALAVLALLANHRVGAEEDVAAAVRWQWQLQPADARPGAEAELVLVATLAPGWVVYSSDFDGGLGPLPARLRKKPQSSLELLAALRSVGAHRKRDADLKTEYGYFAGRAELRQRLKLPADGSPIQLTLNGQACHEADGSCHLLRLDISIAPRPQPRAGH